MKTSPTACTALAYFYLSTFEELEKARHAHRSVSRLYEYSDLEIDKAFQYAMKNLPQLKDAIRNAHKLRSA